MTLLAVIAIKPCFYLISCTTRQTWFKDLHEFRIWLPPEMGTTMNNQLTSQNSNPSGHSSSLKDLANPIPSHQLKAIPSSPQTQQSPIKTEPFWNRDWQGNRKYTQEICECFCYSYFLDHTFVIHGPGDPRQTHIHRTLNPFWPHLNHLGNL